MKKILPIAIIAMASTTGTAQVPVPRYIEWPMAADSADITYYSKKNGFRAASIVAGVNMGVWAFDRYIQKAEFAYIDGKSIRDNLRKGFVWDNDQMGTNMFLHPYHGNLYYNAARSNGYNFWQSGLYAIGGSAMWELFLENEYPSTNDIIATPIGGMALGEMFHRVTDLILDDRRTGKNRFGRELATFIITPTKGLTRLINGDAWKRRPTRGRLFGTPEVSIMLSSGIRAIELKDEIFDKGLGSATEIKIEYGDRLEPERKPYDYFMVNAELNIHSSQPLLGHLSVVGRLIGTELIDDNKRHLNLGLYQHFDYFDSDTISDVSAKIPYKFGTPASVGVGLMYHSVINEKWHVDAYSHFNGILLGATLSDHYKVDNRNYNLASGFSTKLGSCFVYKKDKIALTAGYEVYRMYTWKGYPDDIDWETVNPKTLDAQGDVSQAILHVSTLRLDFKLTKHLYLTSSFRNFIRDTNYSKYDDVRSITSEGKLMLSYLF